MAVQFVDEARVFIKAGDGGRGCVAFEPVAGTPKKRRASGGNGGDGGSVYVVGDANLSTLLDFKYQQHFHAEDGGLGGNNNRSGRSGKDKTIVVPLGTQLRSSSDFVVEVLQPNQPHLLKRGGQGGQGNHGQHQPSAVVDSTGERVEGEWFDLELSLVADVGLIGLPNAGKSSFVRCISAAKPKVGDYAFTTLHPTLGRVEPDEGEPFTVADIPGLIAGAHRGIGLGNRFLRHISRVGCLVFIIDIAAGESAAEDALDTVRGELQAHDAKLLQRAQLVLFNKVDCLEDRSIVASLQQKVRAELGLSALAISAKTGEGSKAAVQLMTQELIKSVH